MSQAIAAAAAEIIQQLQAKVDALKAQPEMAEVLRLHAALNTLESLADVSLTSLASVFGLDAARTALRRDEFFGLSPLEAAKKYLKIRGEARPFDEIVEAIQAHGVGRVDRDQLRMSLSRSTYEIALIERDVYGLVEFYPGLQRGRKRKPEEDAPTVDSAQPGGGTSSVEVGDEDSAE